MKKYLVSIIAVFGMALSMQASAATGSGMGCNTWGKVSYLYQSAAGASLAIVNGYACFISGATARDVSVMSAILSQAEASNKDAIIEITSGGVNVAMNP
jgi:hypothetical protein